MPKPSDSVRIPTDSPANTDNYTAILWILLSVIASSAMTIGVRDLSGQINSTDMVFLRAVFSTLLVVISLTMFARLRKQLRFSKPWQHLLRGALIAFSTQLGFYSISHLPLATVTVLFFMAPIWATILAMPIHGEKVGPRRIIAMAVGFGGALIILRPGFGTFHPAMLAAMASSITFALALTMSRGLARADGAISTYFSSVVVTAIVMFPLALPVVEFPQDIRGYIAGGVIIIAGAIRGYADIEAYRHGEAGLLAPITYLRLVFIGIAAYFMYAEVPDTPTLIGAAVIISATLYIARREAKLRRQAMKSK